MVRHDHRLGLAVFPVLRALLGEQSWGTMRVDWAAVIFLWEAGEGEACLCRLRGTDESN